jgi:hypothetical protein
VVVCFNFSQFEKTENSGFGACHVWLWEWKLESLGLKIASFFFFFFFWTRQIVLG